MELVRRPIHDARPPERAGSEHAARNALFDAVHACAQDLSRQLRDAATCQSLRRSIGRFARTARALPVPGERALAAFTFMLDGVLDPHAAPGVREDARLTLMRIVIEEYYGVVSGAPDVPGPCLPGALARDD